MKKTTFYSGSPRQSIMREPDVVVQNNRRQVNQWLISCWPCTARVIRIGSPEMVDQLCILGWWLGRSRLTTAPDKGSVSLSPLLSIMSNEKEIHVGYG